MPSKMALVDYKKCHPEKCDSGICAAALACSHKLLKQEAPYEIPITDPVSLPGLRRLRPCLPLEGNHYSGNVSNSNSEICQQSSTELENQ